MSELSPEVFQRRTDAAGRCHIAPVQTAAKYGPHVVVLQPQAGAPHIVVHSLQALFTSLDQSKKVLRVAPLRWLPGAALDKPRPKKWASRLRAGPNLKAGINAILLAQLSDGPKRAEEMKPAVAAGGYSERSVASRLEELRKFKAVKKVGDGTWKLWEKRDDKSAA